MSKKLNRKGIVFISGLSFLFLLTFFTNVHIANAALWDSIWSDAGGEDTVKFLTKYQDYLSYGNFFTVVCHWFGWAVIKGLYFFTHSVEGLIPQSLDLLSFLDDSGLQGITKSIINDLVVVLMVLTLVYLGFKTVIAKEPPNFKSVGVNIFISAFLILGLPTLMDTMQDVSTKFYNDTQTDNNNDHAASLSWHLIQENVTDLLYVSSQGFSILDNKDNKRNDLTENSFKVTNLNALITPDTISDVDSDEIKNLAYKLDTDENGKVVADKIQDGAFAFFTDAFKEGYFRYQANFTPIIVGLSTLLVAYLFTLFVFVTTIIEIGFKQVVGLFIFATDLESGQRTKMVIRDITNAFLLIAFTGLSLKMYTVFLTFLASNNTNIFIYIIAMISATFVLIKGSNTIMRYFGVDVGLKDGFAQIAGAYGIMRAVVGLEKSFSNSQVHSKNSADNKPDLSNGNEDFPSINDMSGKSNPLKSINANPLKKGSSLKERLGSNLFRNVNAANQSMNELAKTNTEDNLNAPENEDELNEYNNPSGLKGDRMDDPKIKRVGQENIHSINDPDLEMENANDNATLSVDQKPTIKENELNSLNNNPNKALKTNIQDGLEMKLEDPLNPNSGMDTTHNIKLNKDTKSINQNTEDGLENLSSNNGIGNSSRQDLLQNVQSESINNSNPKNEDAVQNVKINAANSIPLKQGLEIEDTMQNPPSNNTKGQFINQDIQQKNGQVEPKTGHQIVTQDVQKGFEVSPNKQLQGIQTDSNLTSSKQRIVQELEKANAATPQQMQQNVQQVLAAARLPQEAHQTVKRVIEDAQRQGNIPAETIKTKVIQELENVSFGAKEPIKQVILQDIQKAFSATPQQVEQNIKQVVETEQRTKESYVMEQQIDSKKVEKPSYFGSLFGEGLDNYKDQNRERKSSRFDFIKEQ